MDWNKDHIRETMLSLETAALQSARDKYLDYVSTARLDRSESIENDEQAQAEIASDFAEALDDTLDDYADKLDKLRTIDFGPKTAVTEGRSSSCRVATSSSRCQRTSSSAMGASLWAYRRWRRSSR